MISIVALSLSILSIGTLLYFLKPYLSRTLFLACVISGVAVCAMITWQAGTAAFLHTTYEQRTSNRPVQLPINGYIGSNKCQTCHVDKHATWYDTYHRTMTQVATKDTIASDIDNVHFTHGNLNYELHSTDDKLWVKISDLSNQDEAAEEYEIVMTTGSHHYQVYWYETKSPRLLNGLPYVYLIAEKKWIPRLSAFMTPTTDNLPDEFGRWNMVCIRCHTTNGRPGKIEAGGVVYFDSQSSEFGIACEACHGPGEMHAEKMANPVTRYISYFSEREEAEIVNPKNLDATAASQVCGQCHSLSLLKTKELGLEFQVHGYKFRPGDDLEKNRKILKLIDTDDPDAQKIEKMYSAQNSYWKDGMPRLAGREYNGLIRSPCFADDSSFSCLSCHSLHKEEDDRRENAEWANDLLKPIALSNEGCLQCHGDFRKKAEHSNHDIGSAGSECMNCHMPYTSYGLRKAIRSHQISSPNIAESVEFGRVNACNACHLDKSLEWTNQWLVEWYDHSRAELVSEYSDISYSVRLLLKGNAAQRALAYFHMGQKQPQDISGTNWMVPFLAEGLVDPYDVNRQIAFRSLRSIIDITDSDYDFLEKKEIRKKIRDAITQNWQENHSVGDKPEVLINNGRIHAKLMKEIINERDHAPITLIE